MMLKNLRKRPLMKWQVMDMTRPRQAPQHSHIQEISDGPKCSSLPVALPDKCLSILVQTREFGMCGCQAQGGILWESYDL